MVPQRKSLTAAATLNSLAVPLAATILVGGSLLFWTCVGVLWLAARPATQQPIVIWMPPAAEASSEQKGLEFERIRSTQPEGDFHVRAR